MEFKGNYVSPFYNNDAPFKSDADDTYGVDLYFITDPSPTGANLFIISFSNELYPNACVNASCTSAPPVNCDCACDIASCSLSILFSEPCVFAAICNAACFTSDGSTPDPSCVLALISDTPVKSSSSSSY